MAAENASKSCLKKVARGVVSLHGVASCVVNVRSYAVSDLEYAARYSAEVNVYAVGLLCVVDSENRAVLVDSACVAYLTAALAVEGSLVKYYLALALGNGLNAFVLRKNCNDLRVGLVVGVAREFSLRKLGKKGF